MPLLKSRVTPEVPAASPASSTQSSSSSHEDPIIKKRLRFRIRKHHSPEEVDLQDPSSFPPLSARELKYQYPQDQSNPQHDLESDENPESGRKILWPKDMTGKPVFLEDTGEKLGVVYDPIIDAEKHLVGYKIQDCKSDTILSFPLAQFEEDKNGLIFIPSWYIKGIKTVEKLEFKDRITPELMWLITDHALSTEELYRMFSRHDDSLTKYIEEAISLREQLMQRLAILEKERLTLKESLMDLTEKRLIKDIDRREFSDIVVEHRRKVNVLDNNIKKCKDLIDRLQKTSFGTLSTVIHPAISPTVVQTPEHTVQTPSTPDATYQERYHQLKQQYNALQEGYEELKSAVEHLLTQNEL